MESGLDLVIKGGEVVTASDVFRADVGIRDGRIAALAPRLSADRMVDASGLLVLPGGVDTHVHLDQPPAGPSLMCDDFDRGTASAASGGTTTIVSFAWQTRGASLKDTVEDLSSPGREGADRLRFDDPRGKKAEGDTTPFDRVPNGIPGLAARLPLVFHEGVAKGRIGLSKFVDLVATRPAQLFGLAPRKGSVAIGGDADLVLWDPNATQVLTNAGQHDGNDFTPYEGREVRGRVIATYLRGRAVFEGGRVVGPPGGGEFLARAPYPEIAPRGVFPIPFDPVEGKVLA